MEPAVCPGPPAAAKPGDVALSQGTYTLVLLAHLAAPAVAGVALALVAFALLRPPTKVLEGGGPGTED